MTDRELRMPWLRDLDMDFGGDVIVAPQIAPSGGHLVLDHGGNICAAYSLPPGGGRPTPQDPRPEKRLTALLGPTRALILVTLDRPTTMGRLAAELPYAASTLTHHAQRLVKGGLVTSTSIGKNVVLERTLVGHLLVDLLGT